MKKFKNFPGPYIDYTFVKSELYDVYSSSIQRRDIRFILYDFTGKNGYKAGKKFRLPVMQTAVPCPTVYLLRIIPSKKYRFKSIN